MGAVAVGVKIPINFNDKNLIRLSGLGLIYLQRMLGFHLLWEQKSVNDIFRRVFLLSVCC